MPSGRAHEALNLAALGGLALAHLAAGGSPEDPRAWAFGLAYLAGTYLLSPDLDLAERGVRASRRWGILAAFWRPYGWLFRHRGLSHTWLLGPLTRLAYLGTWVGLLLLVLRWTLGLQVSLDLPPELWGFGLLGYYASQWLRLLADGVRPDHGLKRLRRPR